VVPPLLQAAPARVALVKRWCGKCHSIIIQQPHVCNTEKRPQQDSNAAGIVNIPPDRNNWYWEIDAIGLGFCAVFLPFGVLLWRLLWS
jgi:hypothetical protein